MSEFDYKIVFTDGSFVLSECSLPKGIRVLSLTEAQKAGHQDYLDKYKTQENIMVIAVDKGVFVDKPVYILNKYSKKQVEPPAYRMILAERECSVSFIEEFQCEDPQAEIEQHSRVFVLEGAKIHYNQLCVQKAQLKNYLHSELGLESKFYLNNFSKATKKTSNYFTSSQVAPRAESYLSGLFVGDEKNKCENYIEVKHMHPNGISRQMFKSIMLDSAKGSFNGKIFIDKQAQKVESSQLNHNLMLGERAQVNTVPELEIYADDVKANHGATVGFLDSESLFYLMSRGVSRKEAVQLVAQGYALETIEEIEDSKVKSYMSQSVKDYLANIDENLFEEQGFNV